MNISEDEIGLPSGIDTILLEKLVVNVVKGLDCRVWTTDLGCVHVKPGGTNQDPGAIVITIRWSRRCIGGERPRAARSQGY